MPDVTGEQQISHDVTSGQQFLLAVSRPIRIEYGTHLWDNARCTPGLACPGHEVIFVHQH